MGNFIQVTRQEYTEIAASEYSGLLYIDGELVGYRQEWDREEDNILYDYFVREDILEATY